MTFLLWMGSGFAFAVGVVCGLALFKLMGNSSRDDEYAKSQAKTLELLEQRNLIGENQELQLKRIADLLRDIAQKYTEV